MIKKFKTTLIKSKYFLYNKIQRWKQINSKRLQIQKIKKKYKYKSMRRKYRLNIKYNQRNKNLLKQNLNNHIQI